MNKILFAFLLISASQSANSQTCSSTIFPHAPSSSGGNYHVKSDTTINDPNGSNYYICSGVTVTVSYSAGCSYQLEDDVTLTIMDHEGDVIFAKGNCTITDNSSEAIVVNKESTSTFSKPNNTVMGFVYNCSPMVFDYSGVGGSSPCLASLSEESNANQSLKLFPNPIHGSGQLKIELLANKISIYTLSGVLVASYNNLEKNYIQLNNLVSGTYILVAETSLGERLTSRFLVE